MDAAGGRTRQGLVSAALAAIAFTACGPQELDQASAAAGTSSGSGIAATGLSNGGGPAGPAAAATTNTQGASSGGVGPGAASSATTNGTAAATTTGGSHSSTEGSGTTAGSTTDSAAGSGTAGGSTGGSTTGGSTTGTSGGPTASGIWIFRFDYLGYTDWDAVAAAVASQGAGYVLIKGSDGDAPETMTLADGGEVPQLSAATVLAFTSRGIQVYAWSYAYPDDSSAEALAVISSYAELPGVSGLVLDAEVEFEDDSTASTDAADLCSGLRATLPTGSFVGYTSFGIPSDHPSFPYNAFDQGCGDGFFPQLYWSLFSSPLDTWQGAMAQCQSDIHSLGLVAPLWPIGCNYEQDTSGDVTVPTPTANLNAFLADAGATASLWEYPESSWPNLSTFVSQLSAIGW